MERKLETLFDRLWPLPRSITGRGFRESLDILSEIIPLERLRFESGRKVLDWTIPSEWHVNDAFIIDPFGKKHADFKTHNLHLLNYSVPFKGRISLTELRPHLFSRPKQPNAIPYLTSYYSPQWGFCLSHEELSSLPEGTYDVMIDTEFRTGFLELGEMVLPGKSDKEIMFSTYLCHPSMANNELSGPLVMAGLYEKIAAMKDRWFTYRFVIGPETIGSIAYLSERGAYLKEKMIAGFQLTCIGDRGPFTYKLSRKGSSLSDRVARVVLKHQKGSHIIPFDPTCGSDERQYCSPGFNLPFGVMMRSAPGLFPEYHSSLDNKELISFEAMTDSVDILYEIIDVLEHNRVWINASPFGEPQLGRRGLYTNLGATADGHKGLTEALLWVLSLADGSRDFITIVDEAGLPIDDMMRAIDVLFQHDLLKERHASK